MGVTIRTCFLILGGWAVVCLLARPAAAELPPEIMADKYLIHAEQLYAAEDHSRAFEMMRKIVALQKAHDLKLPDDFHFKYARVALAADSLKIALKSVGKYLSAAGKDGKFYNEALVLLLKVEDELEVPEIRAEDTCAGKPRGAVCWKELAGHPQCYVLDDFYREDQTVTWSGKCSDRVAYGQGTLTWSEDDSKVTHTGSLKKGRKHGKWVDRSLYGLEEGTYADGKKHGEWISRNSRGQVWRGPYVDGKQHGLWVMSGPSGTKAKGEYVNGKSEGKWLYFIDVYPDGFTKVRVCRSKVFIEGKVVDTRDEEHAMCRW